MIFLVLYNYLNCAVAKTIDPGHTTDCNPSTTSTVCGTNYTIILLMVSFITVSCKPLETNPCTYVTWVKPPFAKYTLKNLYVSGIAQLENV